MSERGNSDRGGPRRAKRPGRGAGRGSGSSRGRNREGGPAGGTEVPKGRPGWGLVTRRGADAARRDDGRGYSQEREVATRPEWDDDAWVRTKEGRSGSRSKPSRRRAARYQVEIPEAHLTGMTEAQRSRVTRRLGEAAEAYDHERYEEARRILADLVRRFGDVPEVIELYGLTLYRLGRWRGCIAQLERWSELTGSSDQLPVLADCHRAMGHRGRVAEIWDELRQTSAEPAVLTEGRIVAAGALADDGRLDDAIRLLEKGPVRTRAPREHHLRLWYALADLYERSGDLPSARRGFGRISDVDPGFVDVSDRLNSLD